MNFTMNLPVAGPRRGCRSTADVRILAYQSENGEKVRFVFKAEAFPEMKDESRVAFEPRGNRLYFGFSKLNGFKLQKYKTTSSVQVASSEFVKKLHKYIGEFEARYDAEEKCHYIEVKDVPEKTLHSSENNTEGIGVTSVMNTPYDDDLFNKLQEAFTKSLIAAFASVAPDAFQIIKDAVRQGFEEVQ